MRKKDKSMAEREIIDSIIHGSQICHLACSLDDQPYVIPISFGYDGQIVYFHTARAGKKNDIFHKNPRVCLSFETNINLVTDNKIACGWTFDYQSVIATGKIKEVSDIELKNAGLIQIMLHYSGKDWEMPEREISKTTIWQVKIETITGKRSPAKTNTESK
jgi:nitroimidazol reductase NimA-like FMN-containing flavoprotein (pyridoxamine 5'-phosphate oxidase superfamily)